MRDWRKEVQRRLARAQLDGAAEQDIVEELAQHLQDRYAELLARGMPAADARAEVLAELGEGDALARRVGGAVRAKPVPLPIGGATLGGRIGGIWSDVRLGGRMLLRAPIYTGFAALVLALGIGATTAIFTVVNSVLLQPPPGVDEPDRIAGVFTSDYSGPRFGSSSYPDVEAVREAGSVFEDVAGYSLQTFSIVGEGWTARGMGELVTASYFRTLGVRPAIGRFFSADEADPGRSTSVAVISHELWQTHSAGRADVLGARILVRGQPLTVIGVAPREFGGALRGLRTQLWLPLSAPRILTGVDPAHRGNRSLQVRARLREGVSIAAAQRALDVLASRLHDEFPDEWTNVDGRSRVFTIVPESAVRVLPQMRGAVFGGLAVLAAALFTVLLIACTNVANLMLSRASVRRAEMGVRVALGASRGRIVRHLLAESLLLATIGGMLGLFLALWLMRLLQTFRLPGLHVTIQVGMDWRVLAFATAVTFATGLLFGLAPALQASRAPAPLLKDTARGGVRTKLRNALIVVQVACSLMLLIAGALLVRSLRAMQTIDTGYTTDNVVLARFDLASEGWSTEQAAAFYDELLRRVDAIPGTTSRTLVEDVPLGMGWSRRFVNVEGYQPRPGEDMEVMRNSVGPEYFSTMGMTLRRGREFSESDRLGAPPVLIVSEAFAHRFWPGGNPLGRRVGIAGPDEPFAEVIGIAPDAKHRSLDEEPQPYFYYPYLQHPTTTMSLLARTTRDPATLVAELRDAIGALAPALPAPQVMTFRQHVALATMPQRIAALMLSGLGLLAVVIAVTGLYGIIAFGVTQRAREFGIRMALGAAAADVRRLVVGNALRLVGIGIVCGTPLALAVAFLMRSFLLVPPIDPVTFLTVPALLGGCALLASHAPARRATAQDPASALHAE